MKLLFKQRFFSWLDSYDIFDEAGNAVYTVEGRLAWGHCLHILDRAGAHVGTVKEKVLTFLPKFELYEEDRYLGVLRKELTFLRPKFTLDFLDWRVEGSIMEWDYQVLSGGGQEIMTAQKQLLNWTDTYQIDICDPKHALYCLMIVLSIDAAKCSRDS